MLLQTQPPICKLQELLLLLKQPTKMLLHKVLTRPPNTPCSQIWVIKAFSKACLGCKLMAHNLKVTVQVLAVIVLGLVQWAPSSDINAGKQWLQLWAT